MDNAILIAILAAAVVNYMFKIIPMFVVRNIDLKKNTIFKILDYASCCIIGEIIYSAAFKNASLKVLWDTKTLLYLLNIIFIILSFYICIKTGSILKSVFISLSLFTLCLYAWTF
ncbi:AzlD domain-containing protein [Fluviispira vulneris]|uniref:AzlD domain-containing protein n=1 Tax=Fluviispira vulneris TaxID=2763012 RepID=UPI00164788E6|nr:AzlD domain-containing protein [Fluviispira vulneris]